MGNHPSVFLNHYRRKLEDKLQAVRIALRPFTLNLNVEDLHKNRESPSAFMCYLGVIDSSLPVKGTAHRKVRGTPEIESSVNELPVFTFVVSFFFTFPPNKALFLIALFFYLPETMLISLSPTDTRFCTSSLWMRQSLPAAQFPPALNEKDFVVPGSGADTFLSHDQRRNLTDQQETGQWLGGLMVPKSLLSALFSSLFDLEFL